MKEYGGGSCAKCAKKLRLKKEEKRGQKQDPPTPLTNFLVVVVYQKWVNVDLGR